jgi:hypothetical protein
MHTVKVIGIGFALLGLLLFVAPRLNLAGASPIAFAIKLFIPLWFAGALINLAIGVLAPAIRSRRRHRSSSSSSASPLSRPC